LYNLANGEEIAIKLVTEKMKSLLRYNNEIIFNGAERKGDPLNWRADISKLKELGYQQQVTIDEGLYKYVEWLREEKLV
jgi:dTDP-glucose 4,6-dehydratase/UDP-glucose 4-epimerase